MTDRKILRIGFVGAGFIAHFHLKALLAVRNVEVTGVYSPTAAKRQKLADAVAELGLGTCHMHDSLDALLAADDVDALWILSPNPTRLATMRTIAAAVKGGPFEGLRRRLREAAGAYARGRQGDALAC